jgi:hypothetical protein
MKQSTIHPFPYQFTCVCALLTDAVHLGEHLCPSAASPTAKETARNPAVRHLFRGSRRVVLHVSDADMVTESEDGN